MQKQEDLDLLIEGQDQRISTLDFNAERQGSIPQKHRFSSSRFKNQLENIDLYQWGKDLTFPDNDFYSYPSNLDKAELHRQCCYFLPDASFLEQSQAESCPCCQKPLRRKRYNIFFQDMYKLLADEFGITIPLYFTFLKFQIIVQAIIFIVYGLFFLIEVKNICNDPPIEICPNKETCEACQFSGFYSYIDISHFLWYMSTYKERGYNYYQFAAFFVFIINLFMPFCYEILIRYRQYQYWDKEPINHLHENRKSIYVKHLPYKMTQQEIQQTVQKAVSLDTHKIISKRSYLFTQENVIQELVYIYDIHEINEKNQKREELFLNALITLKQIQQLKEVGQVSIRTELQIKNKQQFNLELLEILLKEQLKQLMYLTQEIKLYLKNGLPFTNKVLIKFQTYEMRQAAYIHYKKTWYQNLLIRYEVLKEQQRQYKKKKQVVDVLPERSFSIDDVQAPLEKSTTLGQLQEDYSNKYVEQVHQQIKVQRGFRTHEIFWENLGMNTFQRLKYRLKAVLTIIITLIILMGGFEAIYIYQQNQKEKVAEGYKLSTTERALTLFFTVFVTFLSSYSTLTVLNNMALSRRSTFTELEISIMHFFVFLQYCLINFLPYILTLELWQGKQKVIAIYDLLSLYQSRMIIKQIFHTFHLRHSKFWLRKRKVLKNFNPFLYFQGQLNAIMTPACFPQRGRSYHMLFTLTVSLTLIYVCPMIVVLCLSLNLYMFFYDKYAITHNYQIDRRFNIDHLSYIVKSYQFVLLPFNIYIFMKLFWSFGWLTIVGAPISALVVVGLIFARKPIVNYVVIRIFKQNKSRVFTQFKEQPFFQSYDKFFQGLRIEKLTEQLANIFQGTQSYDNSADDKQIQQPEAQVDSEIQEE